ncbi:hypothetical protein CDL12_12224 [Handroanthus impetiginosus]|uniref:Dof-type domain-containing protein n=1 Tax=Handroanthus impetiginosus TaxID=429701 RepID=A0A2G9HCF7_9LAMI|nr:hypothetical protein CDL12_12224 [Handroanthus impetiginosus]
MMEMKEPEIKLFGRKIVLPENGGVAAAGESSDESNSENGGGMDCDRCLEVNKFEGDEDNQTEEDQAAETCEIKPQEQDHNPSAADGSQNPNTVLESDKNPKTPSDENSETPSIDEDIASENHPKNENEQSDATNGQQKTLKKPDKILPCPRCKSMDTKFCYYNNYNVNQPRHFCKSCQRYWTAGGTMRNVPVGAGRRKSKNSTSHCRHITISEALQAARIDAPNGFHHSAFKPNGTVLSFGPDSPLCKSMASTLNLSDKKVPNGVKNGYHGVSFSCKNAENGVDCSMGSSITTSNSTADGGKNGPQKPVMQSIAGYPSLVPCIPGVPWPFPWNPAVPVPAICPPPPGYPMTFYPPPYWNCGIPNWNVPWLPVPPSNPHQKLTSPTPTSPLGKHSRNGELLKPNNVSEGKEHSEPKTSESSVLVPKTLRIDDPEEAARSSIWETLGIKYGSIRREGLFKALQPKGDDKKLAVSASSVLRANPAALSRAISFQEGA